MRIRIAVELGLSVRHRGAVRGGAREVTERVTAWAGVEVSDLVVVVERLHSAHSRRTEREGEMSAHTGRRPGDSDLPSQPAKTDSSAGHPDTGAISAARASPRRFWSARRVPAVIVALLSPAAVGLLLYDVVSVRAGRPGMDWRRRLADELATRPLDDVWIIVGAAVAMALGLCLVLLAVTPGLRRLLPCGSPRHPRIRGRRASLGRSRAGTGAPEGPTDRPGRTTATVAGASRGTGTDFGPTRPGHARTRTGLARSGPPPGGGQPPGSPPPRPSGRLRILRRIQGDPTRRLPVAAAVTSHLIGLPIRRLLFTHAGRAGE
jgi:hypothetical protein